jgi:hypothetical protein
VARRLHDELLRAQHLRSERRVCQQRSDHHRLFLFCRRHGSPQDAGPFRPFTDKIYVSNLIVPGGSSKYAFNLRGFSPANTPIDPAHGSVTIDDAIGLVRVSDSTINGIASPVDVVQSVDWI